MKKFSNPIILSLITVCTFVQSLNAMTISCDRYSDDHTGFSSKKTMESWYPDYVSFTATDFEIPEDAGTKKVIKVMTFSMGSGGQVKQYWNLLPNGKLIANFPSKAGYKDAATGRYKCSKNALDVRSYLQNAVASKANNAASEKSESTKESSTFDNLTDVQICHSATKNGSWETSNSRWANHVAEAKRRGLSCGVGEKASDNISQLSKLEKAKSTCTDLGFTAGTEKHGDCVMRLIDL